MAERAGLLFSLRAPQIAQRLLHHALGDLALALLPPRPPVHARGRQHERAMGGYMRPVDVVNVDLSDQAAKPELLKAEAFDFFSPMFFFDSPCGTIDLVANTRGLAPGCIATDFDDHRL